MKKADGTYFTKEDYEKIEQIENVDFIAKDDLLLDNQVNIQKDDMYFYGKLFDYKYYNGNLTAGRLPESEFEIILKIPDDYYYVRNGVESLLNQEFDIKDYTTNENKNYKLKIVGVETYNQNNMYYYGSDTTFYTSETVLEDFRKSINQNYSTIKSLFNDKYYISQIGNSYFRVVPSDKVEEGNVIVSDDANYLCSNNRAKNRNIKIEIENIYYKDELNVKVSNTYTKNSFKRLTGYSNYDQYNGSIFVNTQQYYNLFSKDSYQSSVFVKDIKVIDETIAQIQSLGIDAESIQNFKVNDNMQMLQIVKIFKLVITCILIFALFFISYFIIRIILKSRNVYYTTLRMLGATTRNVKKILDIELFINSSLAYLSFIIFIVLNSKNIINIAFVQNLIKYLSLREYIVMYIILIIMSMLISRRFSRKIFKKSAIKTYNEEV